MFNLVMVLGLRKRSYVAESKTPSFLVFSYEYTFLNVFATFV